MFETSICTSSGGQGSWLGAQDAAFLRDAAVGRGWCSVGWAELNPSPGSLLPILREAGVGDGVLLWGLQWAGQLQGCPEPLQSITTECHWLLGLPVLMAASAPSRRVARHWVCDEPGTNHGWEMMELH